MSWKQATEELEKLCDAYANTTHYFNYSRKKKMWVFRFQQIYIKPKGANFHDTAYFAGQNPLLVLKAAVEFLADYVQQQDKIGSNMKDVSKKVISNTYGISI